MKDIKFRAYVKDKQKIYDVKDIDFVYGFVRFEEEGKPTDTMRMFDQVELMQYTGLKDSNGKMIFEGDIVKVDFDPTDTFEVIYFKCGFKLRSKNCCTLYDYSIHDESTDIEVIGNVYDNPELLKEIR